jgi:hypothetical protein
MSIIKNIHDNKTATYSYLYERHVVNSSGALLLKVYKFDGQTLLGTESGVADNKWHRLSGFNSSGMNPTEDLIYGNATDALNGTTTGLIAKKEYAYNTTGANAGKIATENYYVWNTATSVYDFKYHIKYSYNADGTNTKDFYATTAEVINDLFERHVYNADSTFNRKIWKFDGQSLLGSEPARDPGMNANWIWFKSYNFATVNGNLKATTEEAYSSINLTSGSPVGKEAKITYTYYSSGRLQTQLVDGRFKFDMNGDGDVDAADLQIVVTYSLNGTYNADADLNRDGKCDSVDVQLENDACLGIGLKYEKY